MKFTEEKLEQAFIKLLGDQDIPHVSGKTIVRNPVEVFQVSTNNELIREIIHAF